MSNNVTFDILDNADLLLIYYTLLQNKINIDKAMENNLVPLEIVTNEKGLKERYKYKKVDSDFIKQIKEGVKYTTLKQTIEKLQPIIQIIEECGNEYLELSKKLQ
jgi:hypothetical protein